jgi:hypothetical protein
VDAPPLASFSGEEIAAIASIWKRERRTLKASFAGASMLPAIAPGAPIEIVCGDDAAEPGDVILFLHRGQVVVHRLLAARGGWMLTRGDANAVPDLPVRREALVGRASGVAAQRESRSQRFNRIAVRTLLAAHPSLARLGVAFLWRLYGIWVRLRALPAKLRR